MKRMYSVTFSENHPDYNADKPAWRDFSTWQAAYKWAKSELAAIPHGREDPIVTAFVTAFQRDGRFGIIAEFWIPTPNGAVQRKSWTA